ncbi:MAG TPA: PVC-type heme-binding CxxCH protein [Planctomycetota bacterium]|nr:PVC-type heme-binding CxxCH protein [Planctomycetota bacterium]
MSRSLFILVALTFPLLAAEGESVRVLLLGNEANAQQALTQHNNGVPVRCSDDVSVLTAQALQQEDVLVIARAVSDISAEHEAALQNFLESGKGIVVLGSGIEAFPKSDWFSKLLGARKKSASPGAFRAVIVDAQHAITKGVANFDATDVAVTHTQTAKDLRVLLAREESGGYEPLAWTRKQGRGRIFVAGLGHTPVTWNSPPFQKLIKQALFWAARNEKEEAALSKADMQVVPGSGKTLPPLTPADSIKRMHLPAGFRAELYASEPQIVKPLAMAFDGRGRVWIAESVDYPNNVIENCVGNDRIKICEDADGDGVADKFTLFADKLNIPTTIAFGGGGLIVGQAPHILLLKDTNGDDVCDERKILYTGFGRFDTHAVMSNFQLGLDNWMWGVCGYSGGEVTVNGQTQRFAQCCFRFKPDGTAFEVLTSTSNNTWGLGFNSAGDCFISTANNQHAVYLGIPNRFFESVRGWHGNGSAGVDDHKPFHPVTSNVRQGDWFGAFTAAAGMTPYTARAFPKEYWERAAFVCEPTGHIVHIDWLVPRGSSFTARNGFNLMAGADPWIAPIQTLVGPDGAVWVLDWYNYIIIHNNPYVKSKHGAGNAVLTDLRDQSHGRIYRIVHETMKPDKTMLPHQATPFELVKLLGHDNKWWRDTAQRLLIQRGMDDLLPTLSERILIAEDEAFSEYRTVHALWTMHALGAFGTQKYDETLIAALKNSFAPTRRAGLDVLPRKAEWAAHIIKLNLLNDPDPQVRRAALLALAEMPAVPEAGPVIAAMLLQPQNATDQWIPTAAISAAARNDFSFLKAAAALGKDAASARSLAPAVRIVAEHFSRGAPVSAIADVVAALTSAQQPLAQAALAGIEKGWPVDKLPEQTGRLEEDLAALTKKMELSQQTEIVKLAQKWKADAKLKEAMAGVKKSLLAQISDFDLSDGQRALALRQLVSLGVDQENVDAVLNQITPKINPSLAAGIITELGGGSSEALAPQLVKRWNTYSPQTRRAALATLLKRPEWTAALLDAMDKGRVEQGDLTPDQAQQLLRHPDASIAARAKEILGRNGRLPDADRQKVIDALTPLATKTGHAERGKDVFAANCARCHHFGGTGGHVGPELDGLGVREKADILVDILDPNRSVEGNFRTYTIKTNDGRIVSGLLKSENKNSIELLDSDAKSTIVQREDIAKMIASPLSLMPEGFEKIGAEDLSHLLEFLTEKGHFFPLPLEKVATFPSSRRMFLGLGDEEKLIFKRWGPQTAFDIPFNVVDPQGGKRNNAILLFGPLGEVCKTMPKSVRVPCNTAASAIHLLSGVSGWGFPSLPEGSVSLIVRLKYDDGQSEDHKLINGQHFADYISHTNEVPQSKLAFKLREQQMRYLAIKPARAQRVIKEIEFIKGEDDSAPVVMAITVER